jgi:hypothetical protein
MNKTKIEMKRSHISFILVPGFIKWLFVTFVF